MTPYAAALMSALREGLPAMESALTQPMDPDHDLRSLLEGLLPAAAPDHLPEQPGRPAVALPGVDGAGLGRCAPGH